MLSVCIDELSDEIWHTYFSFTLWLFS